MSARGAKGANMKKAIWGLAAAGAAFGMVLCAQGEMFGPVVEGPEGAVFGVGESGKLVAEARNCGDFAIELTNGVVLEMVGIEPGRFTMGSPESPVAELGREDGERPHGVALSHGFWMGRYEVTQGQYEALAGKNPSPGQAAGPDRPVACVTWADAKAFCARLTDREKRAGRLPEGYVYSLPTEAQWEYACRAGTGSALHSGANLTNATHDSAADAVAWYGGNAQGPQEVGTKQGNAWGLFDMHGNVAEWCADGPWEYPQDGGEETDPAGAARNGENMVRGGSWKSDAAGVRSASREKHGWRTKEEDIGFRVALVPALDRDFEYFPAEWMEFAWCPPGSFTMGSPADEEGREPVAEGAEGRKGGKETQREVTLTHGFWMGKHEVTRKQYAGVVGGEAGDEPDLPAVSVSWSDATNYAYRLTAVAEEAGALPEGWEFALPTEAQWEYACRAMTTNALNNGEELEGGDASEVLEEVGWFLGNSQAGGDERHLHAGGELRPNAWGIYDMHGNAWEWCNDWYDASPSSSAATNPAGPASPVGGDERRAIRGGGFRDVPGFCRAAARCGLDPNQSGGLGDVGFRLVLRKTRDAAADPEWTPWRGLECQWYKDGAAIGGATGTVYAIESAAEGDAGDYWLVAKNGFGIATGRVAKVEVDTRPCEKVDDVLWFYEEVGENQATVLGAYRVEGEMEMPAELAGRTVTAVGDDAFAGCTDLEGMALADGVTNVGDRAFAGCTGLAWVECPEGLRSIGEKAFQGTGLMAASLPGLERAGEKAFAGCAVLTECTTGAALEEIPAGMFSGCSNLLSFAVADAAGSIGADAFHSCGSLTNLYIGSNVSEVAAMAITNCGALQVVEAPIALQPTGWTTRQQLGNATVRYYGIQTVTFDAAGGTCEPLSAEFDVQGTYGPLPVPSMDGSVFAGWFREETGTRVREGDKVEPEAAVTLTAHWREGAAQVVDGVSWAFCADADGYCATVLGADPLAGAVEMPAELGGLRVAGIASNAFEGCRALQSMRIPAGVVEVGTNAFAGCRQLGTLTVPAFLVGDAGNWGDGMAAVEIVPYAAQRVTFEPHGGTCAVAKAGYEAVADYGWLPEAEWPLHDFEGWWTEAKGGEPVAATDGVTAETERTLYAHWTVARGVIITEQPESRTVQLGESVTFSVGVRNHAGVSIPLDSSTSLELVFCPAGTFEMGSPDGELGREENETRHTVTLTHDFWLGKYELKQKEYKAVEGTNPSEFRGDDNLPLQTASKNDAHLFCHNLTKKERSAGRLPEGYLYMLPTEAEWEYACRAGTTQALNSGKDLTNATACSEMDEVGWYKANRGDGSTHLPGLKMPNAWGLYDMHGNVEEWCWDFYQAAYPAGGATNPAGPRPKKGDYTCVLRGGSWDQDAASCRSAARRYRDPAKSDNQCGFRVALTRNRNVTVPLSAEVSMEMVWVDAGTFRMGSPTQEMGRHDNETQHDVTLTEAFWLGQFEVSQAQWAEVMGDKPDMFDGSIHGERDDLPIYYVSRDEALDFCAALTARERAAGRLAAGWKFTLPTEAQWEYACRAGTTKALNNDMDLTSTTECPSMDLVGWYKYNSGDEVHLQSDHKESNDPYREQGGTSHYSLYDMHGNVWEWVLDRYGDYPTGAVTDPTGPEDGENYILRGGGCTDDAEFCRSAMRWECSGSALDTAGFRVAIVRDHAVADAAPEPYPGGKEPWCLTGGVAYQWYRDGEAIEGATGASLTISRAAVSDEGRYTVTVTAMGESATSAEAVLAVAVERETVDGVEWLYVQNGDGAEVVGAVPVAGDLTMPETLGGLAVTEVGAEAFKGCTNLTGMTLAGGVTNVGANAFAGCDALATLWVPVGKKGTGLLDDAGVAAGCAIRYYGTQTVTFDAGGGTCGTATKECEIGQPYGELPEAEWAGHGFGGWWAADGNGAWVQVSATDPVTEEAARTLSARWTLRDVTYFDPAAGSNAVCAACTLYGGVGALSEGWWAVEGAVTNAARIAVSGAVHLILCEGAVLVAPKGITVEGEDSLTVWGQSGGTGALLAGTTDGTDATGDNSQAGIGSVSATAGAIAINGGTVTARGGEKRGAGIGGCTGQPCSVIAINGGTVTATGAQWAAGIGNGPDNTTGDGGRVEIHGGTVLATATYRAAGIGGGMNGIAPDVAIDGGTVTAIGSSVNGSGAGIGGGVNRTSGNVTITGGTVTATPGNGAQAIGSSAGWTNAPGPLTIDGMRVTDPADTPEGGRLAACRASATVTLEVCDPHEFADGKCKWCGTVEPVQTVTFDARGGTCGTATRRYDWGATYGELPEATWALHLFDGWWTEAEGGEPVAATNTVTEESTRTFYAHWTQGVLTNGVLWACVENGEGTVRVAKAEPAEGNMIMPETLDGYRVTEVDMNAFRGCTNLTGMVIADGVTYIGIYAFSGCTSLSSVAIPDGVDFISENTFFECTSLTNVTLGAGLKYIYPAAFEGCTSLSSVALPEGLIIIQDGAFTATGLTDVRIPDSVTDIGISAFNRCTALATVWLGKGIKGVGNSAFYGCTNLATVWVPVEKKGTGLLDNAWVRSGCEIRYYGTQTVTFDAGEGTCGTATKGYEIGKSYGELPEATREGWRFVGWFDADGTRVGAASTVTEAAARELSARWGHEETVDGVAWIYTLEGDGAVVWGAEPATGWMRMPDTLGGSDVAGVGAMAFAGSTWLEGMAMPQSVRFVGEGAFARCPALESIRLPDAAEPVGAGAFEGCGALETVWIGPETRTVCTNAFAGCTNLQVVWLHSDWYGRTEVLMGSAAVREEAEYRFYGAFKDEAAEVTWWYWSHEAGHATIMGATPSEGEMALPATVGGDLAVTAVGPEAFWECDGLTGMAIGPGVTNIGSFAFGRTGLEAVTLPDGVAEMGEGAFYQCGALAEAKLGDGLAAVSEQAFHECSNLVSVAFGGNVREIGKGAFAVCTALEEVALPAGLKAIGESAFDGCSALRSAALPEGLESIGPYAFFQCMALQAEKLPEGLAGIGKYAFHGCAAITNLALPQGLAEIGEYAFSACAAMTNVVLPESLRVLGQGAFAYCTALKGVSIPATVEEIAEWAFYGCSKMTWALIPPGVGSIGCDAFARSGILNGKTPDSVTNIAEGAWTGCSNMQEAWIGKSVEKVGQGALANCPALNTVFVHARWKDTDFLDAAWDWTNAAPKPEGVTIMYYDDTEIDGISWRWGELPGAGEVVVFGAEPAAGNLSMPAELGGLPVTTIAPDAFKDCLELTGMVISTNVTTIGYEAFGACSNLVSVTLPEGLKTIDEAAFWRSGLTEVAVPAGVAVCGDYAFSECPALAKATFGDGLSAFGQGVFMLSPALAEVAIPDSVTEIPAGAFYGCSSLTNVTIPQNVTNIAYGAFAFSGLTFVEIPAAVRMLDDCVFWGCPDLLLVYLGRGVESVGAEAFADCPALREVWLDARWRDTGFLDGTWGEGGAPKPDTVTLRYYGDLDYYVRADGDDANDGLSPATAKREISAALALAGPGNTVHVGPGTYGPAMVPQRVILVSDAGAEKTVIRGAEGERCLLVGAEAVVKGFTLRDGDAANKSGAAANGGGARLAAGSRLERCIIRDCKATGLGGAVAPADNAARRKVMVQNCLIVGNEAGAEGGAAAEGVILAHCTVVGNTGLGVRDCAVGGSIVWGNTGAAQAVNCVVEHSLCEGAEGKGDIEGDPLFVGGGDWRLQGASPCIDAATVLAPPVTDDLDGAPRPMPKSFGTGTAALPDMGCYEFAPKALFVSQNGTGEPPYDSWKNATSNLQSAVDAAVDGDIVVVDAGTYGPVSIGPACTVVSLRGAEETVIDAQGASRAVDLLGGGTLEGFTIVNGSADDCAGILAEGGSTVRDVVVVGCRAAGNGGGVCLYDGSTAENVTVASNTAAVGGGFYALTSRVVRCTMTDNEATQSGGGAWLGDGSLMRDSTNRNNIARKEGGGVWMGGGSLFHNNFVEGNEAETGGGVYAVGADGRDSVLVANTADRASALWLQGDEAIPDPGFWNLTIVGNTKGLPVELHDSAVLGNTIVWDNPGGDGIACNGDSVATSCRTDDPGFVETANGERDFHLRADSPCIGNGTVVQPMMEDSYDIDGQARLSMTTQTNLLVDIGADSAALDCIAVPCATNPAYVWRVVPGSCIQLESTPSLDGTWNAAADSATVTNNTWSWIPDGSTPTRLFYRLLWIR
jgi:formylglycine-generating enzyme required for sulfatase activity